LKTAENIAMSSNLKLLRATFCSARKELLVLNYLEKNIFCSILNVLFKVVKMNFGTNFWLGHLSMPLSLSPESLRKSGPDSCGTPPVSFVQ